MAVLYSFFSSTFALQEKEDKRNKKRIKDFQSKYSFLSTFASQGAPSIAERKKETLSHIVA